jgi:hypothetical protein
MRTQSEVSFEDSRIQTVSPGKPTTISSVFPAIAAATRPARLASSIAPLPHGPWRWGSLTYTAQARLAVVTRSYATHEAIEAG